MLKVLIQPEYLAFLNQKQVPTGILIQVLLFLRFALLKAVRSSFDDLNYTRELNLFRNPEEIEDFFWADLFALGSFKVIHCSVINVHCCFRFVQATYLLYHSYFYLSTTFLILFFQTFLWIVFISKTFMFRGQDRMLP